jgi:chromosome segregation ATPase
MLLNKINEIAKENDELKELVNQKDRQIAELTKKNDRLKSQLQGKEIEIRHLIQDNKNLRVKNNLCAAIDRIEKKEG